MHIEQLPFPFWMQLACFLLAAGALLSAGLQAPWRALLAVQARQHAFLGGIICLVIVWSMKISWVPGLILHPLGITAFTVIFGWPLAMIAGAVALITHTALSLPQWDALCMDYVLTVLIPASLTHGITRMVLAHASRNLFLFMLGTGFVGAILGMAASLLCLVLLAVGLEQTSLLHKLWQDAGILAMLLYTEGFLNGMVVAAITVFAPDLVKTFDNRKYLGE